MVFELTYSTSINPLVMQIHDKGIFLSCGKIMGLRDG